MCGCGWFEDGGLEDASLLFMLIYLSSVLSSIAVTGVILDLLGSKWRMDKATAALIPNLLQVLTLRNDA